ncbi:Translation initiation factor IF-3 [Candidatus Vidania fulgoroideae]|nr:Translation initiation factor IF-3 [Candidatus Vidania fulgoroideae]
MFIDLIVSNKEIIRNINIEEANRIAKEKKLSLVKVSQNSERDIYKLYKVSYKKKKRSKKRKTKIIKLSVRIFENDYLNKIKFIQKSISKNDIKVIINTRGRERGNKEQINEFFNKLVKDLEHFCTVRKIVNDKIVLYQLMLTYDKKKNK